MVEITVSHENFEALMNAHTNENICVKHKNLKGEVWLNKRYNNIPTPSYDEDNASCACIRTSDIVSFTHTVSNYLKKGYKVSSSSCEGTSFTAILIKEKA